MEKSKDFKALFYLTFRQFINTIKISIKKPFSLILKLIPFFYITGLMTLFIFSKSLVDYAELNQFISASKNGIHLIFLLIFFLSTISITFNNLPMSFSIYDVNIIFPTSISSKKIFLYSMIKPLLRNAFFAIITLILSLNFYREQVTVINCILLFLGIISFFFSFSFLKFLYYKLKGYKFQRVLKYLLLIYTLLVVIWYGLYSLNSQEFLTFGSIDGIRFLPLIGQFISMIDFPSIGTQYLIGNSLFFIVLAVSTLVLSYHFAYDYYEDAALQADQLEIAKENLKANKVGNLSIPTSKTKMKNFKFSLNLYGEKVFLWKSILLKIRKFKENKILSSLAYIAFFLFSFIGLYFFNSMILKESNDMTSFDVKMILLTLTLIYGSIISFFFSFFNEDIKNIYFYILPGKMYKKIVFSQIVSLIDSFIYALLFFSTFMAVGHIHFLDYISLVFIYVILSFTLKNGNLLYQSIYTRYTSSSISKFIFSAFTITLFLFPSLLFMIPLGIFANMINMELFIFSIFLGLLIGCGIANFISITITTTILKNKDNK